MKVYRALFVASILCATMALSAQKTAEFDKSHPEIQSLIEDYELSTEQAEKVINLYEGYHAEMSKLDKMSKENQMKRKENLKTATPDEKAKLNAEMDGLALRHNMLKAEREKAFVAILTEKQVKRYEANVAAKKNKADKKATPQVEDKMMQKTR